MGYDPEYKKSISKEDNNHYFRYADENQDFITPQITTNINNIPVRGSKFTPPKKKRKKR